MRWEDISTPSDALFRTTISGVNTWEENVVKEWIHVRSIFTRQKRDTGRGKPVFVSFSGEMDTVFIEKPSLLQSRSFIIMDQKD